MTASTSATQIDKSLTNSTPERIITTDADYTGGHTVTLPAYTGKTATIVSAFDHTTGGATAASVSGNLLTIGSSGKARMAVHVTYQDV